MDRSDDNKAPERNWWMYSVLPYQMAYGPISTIIALYILFLHGTVIDVAYAASLGYAVSIPSSIFWGIAIDKYNKRRDFVMLSFVGLALALAALFLVHSLLGAILIYGFISFIVVANATPLSLLVMDRNPREKWAEGFSRLQMLSSLGGMLGLVFAFAVAGFLPIDKLILLLVPFCIAAIALSFLITDERVQSTRRSILSTSRALDTRLFSHPLIFVRLPQLSMLASFFRGLAPSKIGKNYLGLFYLGSVVFYIGSALFNTAYPAGLKEFGLQNFSVFGVILAGYMLQTLLFGFSGKLVESRDKIGTAIESVSMRGAAYVLIGVLFIAFGRTTSVALNAIVYAVGSGLAYAVFYTVSNVILFEAIGGEKRGRKLGIYSSMIGLGSIVGALLSGYTSFYVGYWFTFALAGALMVVTAAVFHNLSRVRG